MNYITSPYAVKHFVDKFNTNKVYVDPRFQRRCVWNAKNRQKYLASLVKGEAFSWFVVADVESCLEKSIETADTLGAQTLEDLKKKGYKYVSVDGQNRTNCIERFILKNDTYISGEFLDASGDLTSQKNKNYKALPTRLRDAFDDAILNVVTIENTAYSDIPDIFKNVNDGVPLNNREKRNAISSPISDFLRNLAESPDVTAMWPKIFAQNKLNRMYDIEFCAKSYIYLNMESRTSTDINLNKLYEVGKGRDITEVEEYSQPALNKCRTVMENVAKCVRTGKDVDSVSQRQYWSLLIACSWLYDNNIDVVSYGDLYDCVKSACENLKTSSKIEHAKILNDPHHTEQQAEDKNFYWYWVGQSNNGSRPDSRLFITRAQTLINYLNQDADFNNLTIDKMAA